MAGVDEAEARRAPQGDDDPVDDAVQRGVRGRQRLVDRVGGLEVVSAVLAPGPGPEEPRVVEKGGKACLTQGGP